MLFGDGIGTLAYAMVADYAKAHFSDAVARTAFYNDLDLATNLLGAAMQLTLTRWLLIRRGAGWGLVVPTVVNVVLLAGVAWIGGGSLLLFGAAVPALGAMLVITRGFAYGMTKPAVDALYTRVPRETRYKGKNFVETAVWRFGDVLVTSAVSGLRMLGWSVGGLALLGAGVAAMATVVARRAGWSPDLAPEDPAGRDAPPA
jgi:AAA family ATP:ADP antiporter